jgi:endonuclease-3
MTQAERYKAVLAYVYQQPEVKTELRYEDGYQLLIAVVLSAQCTDKRVNLVTPALFKAFPTALHLAHSSFEEVFPYIKSISYPNNKTKHLIAAANVLVEKFQGQVPNDLISLQTIPGVGRKSANAIGAILYDIPALAVDTHVMRVSKRIGLVPAHINGPLAIERELLKHIPIASINRVNSGLILHGRYTCLARKPQCSRCSLSHYCLYFSTEYSKA